MAEPINPGPGRSTSEAAVNEIKKQVARRNDDAHKAARKLRTASDREQVARRRRWEWL
jgi:hypothetical protein